MKKSIRAVPPALLLSAVVAAMAVPVAAAWAESDPPRPGVAAGSDTAPAENIRFSGRFVLWTGGTKTWVALPGPTGVGAPAAATSWQTKEQAAGRAATWSFPAPDVAGPIQRGDLCLAVGLPGTRVTTSTCDGSAEQQLSFAETANGTAIRSSVSTSSYVDFDPAGGTLTSRAAVYSDGLQFDLLAPVNLRGVKVDGVTKGSVGRATLTGTGTVGASVSTPLAGEKVEVGSDGRWILEATGIPSAGADLTVTQSIADTSYGTASAHVHAWDAPGPPTATWTFPEDVRKNAVVSGTGVDGATISIREGTNEVASAGVENGAWSTEVDALGSGTHEVTVTQSIGGLESPPMTLEVDYGQAVSITSPADGSDAEGGTVDVSGRGEPGSLIEVRIPGSDDVVGTTWVEDDGTWRLEDVPLT